MLRYAITRSLMSSPAFIVFIARPPPVFFGKSPSFVRVPPPLLPPLPAVVSERVKELDRARVCRQGEVADDGDEDDEGGRDENPRRRHLEHL